MWTALLSSWLVSVPTTASAAPGDLDVSFGDGGWVFAAVDDGHTEYVGASAIQPNGKIIVVGALDEDLAAWRFATDGTLDTSFGVDGAVPAPFAGRKSQAFAVENQTDGSIVATGYAGASMAVVRFLPDGTLDASFGTGDGRARFRIPGLRTVGIDVEVLTDGSILVLGVTERRFTERTPRIVRFDPDGTLDLDFGDNGSIRHPGLSAITVDDRGIIAVGIRGSRFQVARFSLDGVPDPSFGRGGVRGYCLLPGKCDEQLYDLGEPPEVEVDGAGNIVLALGGYSDRVSGEFGAVARLTAEGRRDQTFSNDGIAFGGSHVNDSRSLVIQEDGAIVLTGYDFAGGGSGENYAFVARFENDGDLDESFGESGVVIATPGEYAWTDGTDVEVTPDGKIVLLAEPAYDYLHDSFILARFLGA